MRDATIGPAAAVSKPSTRRVRRRPPNELTVPLQIIASPQNVTAIPSTHVRRARSARMPNGMLATAATIELTATRSPISVLEMPSP
jgi:hypothetical protein